MSRLNLELPDSLLRAAHELAGREGVPVEQLATLALAEKVSALRTLDYLRERAKHANLADFDHLLAMAPDVEPEHEADRLIAADAPDPATNNTVKAVNGSATPLPSVHKPDEAQPGIALPEVPTPAADSGGSLKWMLKYAGCIEGPADFAAEHDHYIYGTPKHSEQ